MTAPYRTAGYLRLSREDGDKPESESISGQRSIVESFVLAAGDMELAGFYVDDGVTGTSFDRPGFTAMIRDITAGKINCVVVKDLSRFGRDYIESGRYLDRWFPERGVRFIAVNDGVDSARGSYDMLVPIKNVFNAQYARDISQKVRSALWDKRRRGRFIGAFAPYGYKKDPARPGRLVVDEDAAAVVRRIYSMAESGQGQAGIAALLNREGVPCPSLYKSITGDRYRNGNIPDRAAGWTYATVHRILRSRTYMGSMEQGRGVRRVMHGAVTALPRQEWTVVPGTHEAVVSPERWQRVQDILDRRSRQPKFGAPGVFAGLVRCGDCGRTMVRRAAVSGDYLVCGAYKRGGPGACSPHTVRQDALTAVILEDINRIIRRAGDLSALMDDQAQRPPRKGAGASVKAARERLISLKKAAYEDYRDGVISKEDFLRYRDDYEKRLSMLRAGPAPDEDEGPSEWVRKLLDTGRVDALDRASLAETVEAVTVFSDGTAEIRYRFSADALGPFDA